jgi:hypothetical protein
MLLPHRGKVSDKISLDHAGQHRDAILVALAAANDDLVASDVDVLNAQSAALEDSETRAVKHASHQSRRAREAVEERAHLVAGEDDGKPRGPLGAHEVVEPRQLDTQHVAVEKEQPARRLVLGGRGHVAVDGQRGEEARDLRRAQFGRVSLPVEEDVAADPGNVRFFSAAAVVPCSENVADAIQEAGLRADRGRRFTHRRQRDTVADGIDCQS